MRNIESELNKMLGYKMWLTYNLSNFISRLIDVELYFPIRKFIISNIQSNLKRQIYEKIEYRNFK